MLKFRTGDGLNMKKKIVIAGMIFSLLVPMGVNAQNVGNVTHVNGVMYPVASGISSYDSGKDLADDLFRRICGYEDGEDSEDLDISDSNEYSSLDEHSIENDEEYNNEDKKVIDYFNEGKETLKEYAESEDYDNLKRKAKEIIVKGIDFLFYDGKINGITRDKITEEGKKEVIESVESTIEFIDGYFPEFSTGLGQKYSKARDFLREKRDKGLESFRKWLGEDTYEGFSRMGEDFIKDVQDLWDIIGESYGSWKLK